MSGPAEPVLVVGSGFGCRIHVPALRAAGFDVVGLVGTDADRTARRAQANGIAGAFTDLDEAITRTGAVAVSVASPPGSHAALSLAAIARGCHVLCEKPFAMNTAEARDMVDAAARAGVVNLIGHEFRWLPYNATIARAIADGLIGEPRFVTLVQYMALVTANGMKMPDWWFDESAGGGWLGASGSHQIDQVRSWLGEFASLSAALPTVSAREGGAEDSFVLRFRLANGAEGVLQQSAGAYGPLTNITRVAGTAGTVWIDGETVWIADSEGKRALPLATELTLPAAPDGADPFTIFELGPYQRLCEAFRDGIRGVTTGNSVALPTFADGLAEMLVLDAIRQSAAQDGIRISLE